MSSRGLLKADRYTHFVGERPVIEQALEAGTPVTSVCGKVWVPSRDPDAFPLCPVCVEAIRRGWAA